MRYASYFKDWGENEREYLVRHLGQTPSGNSCICRKHLLEAKRHNDDSSVPKWKGTGTCSNPSCTHQGQGDKMIKPSFVPVEKLKAALKISSTGEAPLVLCQHCYNELYAQFHPLKTCASCGAKPKVGSHLCRHSPDAAAVTQHLQETTGTEVIIQPSDCLCYTCYPFTSNNTYIIAC